MPGQASKKAIFTKGPADVLAPAASEIAIGIDATKKLPAKVSDTPGRE